MILTYEFSKLFGILALISFIFLFWRDADREGYSSDKILDSAFTVLLWGLLGGKFLFRGINLGFLRYELLSAPITLEGVLVGGLFGMWFIARKNHWELWKIGDMIASSLTFAEFLLFFGYWLSIRYVSLLVTSLLFLWLYFILFYLKTRLHYGSSFEFHALKRLNIKLFSGGLFITYLTGSSLIAMIFLVSHHNTSSGFWWFQIVFYLTLLIVSFILYIKQLRTQKVSLGMIDKVLDKIQEKLNKRKGVIDNELKRLSSEDPFIVEMNNEMGRNIDSLGDEVEEQEGHAEIEVESSVLREEKEEIERTLKKMNNDSYGKCEKCGVKISEKRLEAYPTARYCEKCEKELEKTDN